MCLLSLDSWDSYYCIYHDTSGVFTSLLLLLFQLLVGIITSTMRQVVVVVVVVVDIIFIFRSCRNVCALVDKVLIPNSGQVLF